MVFDFLLFSFFLIQLIRTYHFGFFSPYFLVSLHLYIGIFLRYLYLSYDTNSYKLVGLGSDYLSASAFYELCFGYFIFFIFTEVYIYLNRKRDRDSSSTSGIFVVNDVSAYGLSFIYKLALFVLVAYFVILFYYGGNIVDIYNSFSSRVVGAIGIPSYLTLLPDFYVVLVFYFYFVNYLYKKNNNFKAAILIFFALFILFLSGARGNFLQFVMTCLMIHMTLKFGKVHLNKNIVYFLALVLTVLVLGLVNRITAQQENIEYLDALDNVTSELTEKITGTFAVYDHYVLSREYTLDEGFNFGKIYINSITKPIPRSFWDSKPESLDISVRYHFWGDKLAGIPPGLFGEFYISFGIFGFVFLTPIFSYIVYRLNVIYIHSCLDKKYILFASILTPYVFFSLIRLGFDVTFTRVTIFIVFLLFVRLLSVYRIKF